MKKEPLAGNPFLMRRNKYQPPNKNRGAKNNQWFWKFGGWNLSTKTLKDLKNVGACQKIITQKIFMRFSTPLKTSQPKNPGGGAHWQPPQPGAQKHPRFRNAAPKARPVLAEPPAALEVRMRGIWEMWKLGGATMPLKMHLKKTSTLESPYFPGGFRWHLGIPSASSTKARWWFQN